MRATVDATTYEATPPEARDPDLPGVIHWWTDPQLPSGLLAGAYWALSWSLSYVFGDVIGQVLEQATLQNVERWNGTSWDLVA